MQFVLRYAHILRMIYVAQKVQQLADFVSEIDKFDLSASEDI